MNNFAVKELYSKKHAKFPNADSLLKISLGLILFTIISTALVYAETMSVDVEGTSFDIQYDATGMTISGIEADTDFISLILTVDVIGSSGILDISLDRSFFDSTYQGLDDDFIILVDGDEPVFSETNTSSQSRTLSIELPAGTEEIEIIGSVFGGVSVPVEEPTVETPVEPTVETPVEEPTVETPVEEPTVETPVEETPVVDTPKTQCGPGTILKNGVCVLDERCGPGTILKNGACVIDPTVKSSSPSVKGMGKDLMMGFAIAFAAAGIVGVILGIVAKASKSN